MSSRNVQYVVEVLGRIQPEIDAAFRRIAEAAKQAGTAIAGAEKALAGMHVPPGLSQTAAEMRKVEAAAKGMAAAEQYRMQATEKYASKASIGIARLRKEREADEAAAAKAAKGGGFGSGPLFSGNHNIFSHAANAWLGASLIKGGAHAVGGLLEKGNEEVQELLRMRLLGFTPDQLEQADKAASAVSAKFQNLSRLQGLKMIYEGVGIHGTPEHALERVEYQAKLGSFLKLWEGGKHAGKEGAWAKEEYAAIKSMEMMGTLSKENPQAEIGRYLDAMASIRTFYGDNAKLTSYLTMQQRAGWLWTRLSEDFRYNIAPALMQERNPSTVGQQLMTQAQTVIGGTKLSKNQVSAMKNWGFQDPKTGRWRKDLQDIFQHNPFEFNKKLVEEMAAKSKLDMKDPAQLEKLKDIMVGPGGISWLFPNRNAASASIDAAINLENYLKHAAGMKAAQKALHDYAHGTVTDAQTFTEASQRLSTALENVQRTFARPLVGTDKDPGVAGRWADWAAKRGTDLDQWLKQNPNVSTYGMGAGVAGIGAIAAAGAVSLGAWISKALRVGSLLRVLAFTPIGRGLVIGAAVVGNWERIAAAIQKISGVNLNAGLKSFMDAGMKANKDQQAAADAVKAGNQRAADHQAARRAASWGSRAAHHDVLGRQTNIDIVKTVPEQIMDSIRYIGRVIHDAAFPPAKSDTLPPGATLAGPGGGVSPSERVATAAAEREISVRVNSQVTVAGPGSIPVAVTVNVQGTVNGPISGAGSGSGMADFSSRGQTSAAPGPTAPTGQ